jgi:hypothetical protein
LSVQGANAIAVTVTEVVKGGAGACPENVNPLELLNTPVVTGLPTPLMSLKNIPIEGFEKAKFVSFAVKLIVATLSTQLPDAVTFTSCADAVPDTSAWKPTAAITIRNRPAVFLNIAFSSVQGFINS